MSVMSYVPGRRDDAPRNLGGWMTTMGCDAGGGDLVGGAWFVRSLQDYRSGVNEGVVDGAWW